MSRILRATITAKNEEKDLEIYATIDIKAEDASGHGVEKVEARLQDFVIKTSLTMGLIYESGDVVWRERGNRNRLKDAVPTLAPILCSHLLPGPHTEREGKWLLTREGAPRSTVLCNYCKLDRTFEAGDSVLPIEHWRDGLPVVAIDPEKH